MRHLVLTLLKKRWYIFLVLSLLTTVTTFVLWNNTSLFIQALPHLQELKAKESESLYDILVLPSSESDGRIIQTSATERDQFLNLLKTGLFHDEEVTRVYGDRTAYLAGQKNLAELPKVSFASLQQELSQGLFHPEFFNQLLVTNISREELNQLEQEAKAYSMTVTFTSLAEGLAAEGHYYQENLLFTGLSALLFFALGGGLVNWVMGSFFKICQTEIYLLRVLGLSRRQLTIFLTEVVAALPLFAYLTTLFFIQLLPFVQLSGMDVAYLGLFFILFILLSYLIIAHKVRRLTHA